jgi:hypothetical protein
MAAWDIDPPGVSGVVLRTKTVAEDFEGELTSIQTALTGGAEGSASEIVYSAVAGYSTHVAPEITFVVHRTGQVMTAAVNATNAYLRGDLEMAARAQRSATAAPPPDDVPGLR